MHTLVRRRQMNRSLCGVQCPTKKQWTCMIAKGHHFNWFCEVLFNSNCFSSLEGLFSSESMTRQGNFLRLNSLIWHFLNFLTKIVHQFSCYQRCIQMWITKVLWKTEMSQNFCSTIKSKVNESHHEWFWGWLPFCVCHLARADSFAVILWPFSLQPHTFACAGFFGRRVSNRPVEPVTFWRRLFSSIDFALVTLDRIAIESVVAFAAWLPCSEYLNCKLHIVDHLSFDTFGIRRENISSKMRPASPHHRYSAAYQQTMPFQSNIHRKSELSNRWVSKPWWDSTRFWCSMNALEIECKLSLLMPWK